jgi:uncharacterized membrane protein HdeD (DUF308 family)
MTTTYPTDRTTSPATLSTALAQNWWAIALRGVLGILFGLLALFQPTATMQSLTLLFAIYAFVDGMLAIIAAVRAAKQHERWGYLLLEGIVGIIAAAATVVWPAITVLAFIYLVAGWASVSGALVIAAAFTLDGEDGRWWLVLGGVVSLVYGGVLAVAPLTGAIVLTWWLGVYAIAFGVALLIAGSKLRSAA